MNLNKIFVNDLVNLGTKFDYIYSLEIKGVLSGFKKIAKLEPFTKSNLEQIKPLFDSLGIKYVFYEKKESFDKNKMLFLKAKQTENKYIDIYISKSQKTIDLLNQYIISDKDIKSKNFLIGKLLGYPECCIKEFLKNNYTSDFDFNLIIKLKTKGKLDWRLNNLINPYSLIPFFPCSYNCENAIVYAEQNLNIIGKKRLVKNVFSVNMVYKNFWEYQVLERNVKLDNSFNFE